MLPPKAFTKGHCSVCNMIVLLKFRDHATGLVVGQCCIDPLLATDKAIALCTGLRAPTPDEAQASDELESRPLVT